MPHGTPDWAMNVESALFALVDNLAELPPRLGYPSSIDRRGSVLLMETFGFGVGGATLAVQDGGEVAELSADYARYSRFSVKLARIASTNSFATVSVNIPALTPSSIGAESYFIAPDGYPMVLLSLNWLDGERVNLWRMRWDTKNELVYVGGPGAGEVCVPGTFAIDAGVNTTRSMKLVGSVAEKTYLRAYIDGQAIPIPDVDVYSFGSGAGPLLVCGLANWTGLTTASTIYVNALIITAED